MKTADQVGVVFDMDGVLVDSAQPHFRSWQLLAAENATTVTEEQFTATFGRQNKDIIPLLFGAVPAAQLARLSARKEEIYRDLIRAEPPIVRGARALVRALHGAGAALAVGSSGPRANIQLVLEALGATELMSAVVSGEEVTRGKPDPEVFTLACRRLGLTPRHCIVVEDAPVGVEAAVAAGAHAIAVLRHHPAEAFKGVDFAVEGLADLTVGRILALVRP